MAMNSIDESNAAATSKNNSNAAATNNDNSNVQYVSSNIINSNSSSLAMKRIRTPHPHDVLCGRGGGINSHAGNKTFRNWVRERKESYNLANSKAAKAQISREILDRVRSLVPPGRFLMREEVQSGTSTFWVEIDDTKAMAKTSQALREGAPSIRAKAKAAELEKHDYPKQDGHEQGEGLATNGGPPFGAGSTMTQRLYQVNNPPNPNQVPDLPHTLPVTVLSLAPPAKMQKTNDHDDYITIPPSTPPHPQEVTPNFHPVHYTSSPPIIPLPPPQAQELKDLPMLTMSTSLASVSAISPRSRKRMLPRTHSLALSDISAHGDLGDLDSEFHDPFASEDNDMALFESAFPELPSNRSRMTRLTSNSSEANGKSGDGSIRSLVSDSNLSDLMDNENPPNNIGWDEGLKDIYDATHSGITGDVDNVDTILYPYNNMRGRSSVGTKRSLSVSWEKDQQ